MKHLLSLLLCVAMSVYAAPGPSDAVKNMTDQCRCVMDGGVCAVTNDPNPPRPGGRVFTTAGPISADVYNAFRAQGPMMCEAGRIACSTDWDGETCRAGFRLMFRQTPAVCIPAATGKKG